MPFSVISIAWNSYVLAIVTAILVALNAGGCDVPGTGRRMNGARPAGTLLKRGPGVIGESNSAQVADLPDRSVFCRVVGPSDSLPQFDAYLTWKGFNGIDGTGSDVTYVWNGTDVGKGEDGFCTVLNKMKTLRRHATILVYPRYSMTGPGDYRVIYPFDELIKSLEGVVQANDLMLILSAKDQHGNALPTTREFRR